MDFKTVCKFFMVKAATITKKWAFKSLPITDENIIL